MKPSVLLGLIGLVVSAVVLSQDVQGDAVLIAHMGGTLLPNGQMWYELDGGPVATRAIRMYSEPSHTRVAMVADPAFLATSEGSAWMASLSGELTQDVTYSTTPMSDAHPRFQQPAVPDGDTWIALWVYGDYFGTVEDRLVAEQFIGSGRDFGSSAYLVPGARPSVQSVPRGCPVPPK